MKLNMVVASNNVMACRIFIGCDDLANEFGAWLMSNGMDVRIQSDTDPRTEPRLKEEEDMANALIGAYNEWRRNAQEARA